MQDPFSSLGNRAEVQSWEPTVHPQKVDVAGDPGGSHPDGAVHRPAADLRLQTEPSAGKVPVAGCLQSALTRHQDFPDAVGN